MAPDNPWLLAGMILAGGVVARCWRNDYRTVQQGKPAPQAFPGATRPAAGSCFIADGGTLVLLAGKTAGEHAPSGSRRNKAG